MRIFSRCINTQLNYFNTKSTTLKNILFDTYKRIEGTYYKGINNVNVNSIPTTSNISGRRLIDFEKSEGINIIFDGDLSLYDISTIDSKNVIYQSELVSSLRLSIKTAIIIDVFYEHRRNAKRNSTSWYANFKWS